MALPKHARVTMTGQLRQSGLGGQIDDSEIKRLNQLYAALSELHRMVVRVKSREELFEEVCRIATEKAGFQLAWVGWVEKATTRVVPIARAGKEQDYLQEVAVYADDRPEGRGPAGMAIREGKVFVVHDFLNDPSMSPWHAAGARHGFRTVASLPIRFQGEVVGTLNAYDSQPNVIQGKELALLEEASAAISFALEGLDREAHRRQAEERLRASEANFREAQEVASLGSYLLDIPAGLWTSSEVLDRIFGIQADYPRTLAGWGDLVHPEERQMMLDYFQKEVFGNRQPFDREYRIVRHADKQVRWVHGHGRLEFDATGCPVVMLGTILDITDRKRAEQEKLEMERRLLHAQKLESLGILAGGIAHDFNNILAGIMGYADLAKKHLPASSLAQRDIDVIKKAAHRAADLTRQMLAYSGKGKFIIERASLSLVVQDMRPMLAMSISKKATLTFHLASELPTIEADFSQVHQILLNLVLNASEALGDDPGIVTISTDTVHLNETDCAAIEGDDLRAGLYVRLEVADTGCGMDQETLAKIYDPFFTTKFTGRGLGLAAVHGILRGHTAGIRVASKPGQGTKFEIFFPAIESPAPARAEDAAPAPPWRGDGTVLVVDDEETVRDLARRMIELAGFSVLTACDGEEAIGVCRERREDIACVLLDLTMPKMNGEETFRELRQFFPGIRVVLSSGYTEESVSSRFSDLGLAGFIQKPYQSDTLIATLRKAVTGK
jgi:PAS domain S-box-containing protein